ncbi:MAG: glycoside hydrolase family 97 protein [Sphingobacteriales bacterium]|nr:MAG: glycoside hydrolase family 97 protein [Sphingobacteriales bacterium]
MPVNPFRIFPLLFILFFVTTPLYAQQTFSASMGKMRLACELSASGVPSYSVWFNNQTVVQPSSLGFTLGGGQSLDSNFKLIGHSSKMIDETWQPVWGEVNKIRNHYQQLTLQLQQQTEQGTRLNIIFRIFEDGVGFRYEFPAQPHLKYFVIEAEKTAFNLTGNHKAFWIPGDYDSNEYLYSTTPLGDVNAWKFPMISPGNIKRNIPDKHVLQTPLMLKTNSGLYINIHEAALVNYPAMMLHVDTAKFALTAQLVPDALGNRAYVRAAFATPWRSIIVSDKATDILTSKMIVNLNEPAGDYASWVRPMKYIGVWWEMQTGHSSWNYTDTESLAADGNMIANKRHAANTTNVKQYIDFASANKIDGVLVEGWNKGWEEWTGNWNEENFDYVTPYPDFDVAAIAAYAKLKGVKMIMHNETGGSAANYDRHLDTAFKFMNRFAYPAVKTGYVGSIMPKGEHHDGQWMVKHYLRTIQKAAAHKVMINIHEPVRPTGLHRTYPNFVASEAGRGNEWNAFADGSPPEHETILPFTRLMGGPMDYTPGIFKLRNYAKGVPGRQMHSTLAKQLALYVTMYSPLQMAADLPQNYEAHMDAFQFIKDVPVDWDDTQVLEAEPGDFISIARKEKATANWYIGAITDEQERTANLPLRFLQKGKQYEATIYADAGNAHWQTNPEAYKITKQIVNCKSVLQLKLAAGGGAAVSIVPKK